MNDHYSSSAFLAPDSYCNVTNFGNGNTPSQRVNNGSSILAQIRQCSRVFLIDLGYEFVKSDNYDALEFFLYYSTVACMEQRIGRNVTIKSLLKTKETPQMCCDPDGCGWLTEHMDWNNYLYNYGGTDLVWSNSSFVNSYAVQLDTAVAHQQDAIGMANYSSLDQRQENPFTVFLQFDGAHLKPNCQLHGK
jgi:hypothetical protein